MTDNTTVLKGLIRPDQVAGLIGVKNARAASAWCKARGIEGHPIGSGDSRPRYAYSYDRIMECIRREDAELHGEDLAEDIILKELQGIKKILKSLKDK